MDIFVGNLTFTTTEEELAQLFHPYGEIASVRIMTDRETGRSRGFGFVEMPNAIEANAAIAGLDGTALGGRALTVNEAPARGAPPARRWGRDGSARGGKRKDADSVALLRLTTLTYPPLSEVAQGTETRRGLCYDTPRLAGDRCRDAS